MASLFAHVVLGVALGEPWSGRSRWRVWLLAAFCAFAPDLDVIGYKLGVPYASVWGHRGFTHSILFAAVLALLCLLFFRRERGPESDLDRVRPSAWRLAGLWLVFFLATASHGVLDAMTTGGLGIAFFWPLDDTRYFFPAPWRVIAVSPLGIREFFSEWGLRVIKTELVYVIGPSALVLLAALILKRIRRRPTES